jgi:transcriptional regulator with XRE-family HTH domain
MKERISEFLKRENKSSALFAEEIGVQPSGISHILSGRNKPSLDFVMKMLETYPYLAVEWLLFGRGEMYKRTEIPDLFGNYQGQIEERKEAKARITVKEEGSSRDKLSLEEKDNILPKEAQQEQYPVTRIVLFYDNNTFEEYFPGK